MGDFLSVASLGRNRMDSKKGRLPHQEETLVEDPSFHSSCAPELYYSDPSAIFDHCKQNLSKFVALRHDYALWEFTIFVQREPAE